jgi:hypothetical protein
VPRYARRGGAEACESCSLIGQFVQYFVAWNRLGIANDLGGNNLGNQSGIGVLVAAAWGFQSAEPGATAVYLRNFLLFADYAAAKKAEKMAGDAQRAEKWGQGRDQRRAARDDHQPQRRCAGFAPAAR